ncbi:glycosyl hydrolase family 43 [Crateriforma spongiae]|uniref:glycosyl hydrolase family 43 n=1 Tax=Crateriforma spongiae TaxID=2724528 RepID=UPI0039AF174C
MPDPPGQVDAGVAPKHQAYLFAHMLRDAYGKMVYSVSTDGLKWELLNGGVPVLEDYRGHPDICQGHDGRYYLVGNRNDKSLQIHFWVSEDLMEWTPFSTYTPDLNSVPGYPDALPRVGAPKLYFDQASSRYLLTWHTPHRMGSTEIPEPYWASQRTLSTTSRDLITFEQPPRRLLRWESATIDTLVRRVGDRYFAIIKDERYPTTDWPTGKTIRICSSDSLTGPYTDPGPPISPNFREAPTLISSPNGQAWYLYFEQYPGVSYGLTTAAELDGPWVPVFGDTHHKDWDKYRLPEGSRHGCMLPISMSQHRALRQVFPVDRDEPN